MLTKIKIKNFKTFKEEITIDICQKNSVIAILGRNASGKSSIFEAVYNIKGILENKKDIASCYKPYAFNEKSKQQPCEFTVIWYIDNTEYTYFISFNEKNILHESLRNGNLIFEREKVISLNGETLDIFTGFEKVSAFYLLSIITMQIGTQEHKHIFNKINEFLSCLFVSLDHMDSEVIKKEEKKAIRENLYDIRISNLTSQADPTLLAVLSNASLMELKDTPNKNEYRNDLKDIASNGVGFHAPELNKVECLGYHVIHEEIEALDFREESEGTKKLFRFAPKIYKVLDEGGCFFVDELDSAMHPTIIADVLVPLFANENTNPKKAKLIFSMHNIGLLEYDNFKKNVTVLGIDASVYNKSIEQLNTLQENFLKKLINGYFGAVPIILETE